MLCLHVAKFRLPMGILGSMWGVSKNKPKDTHFNFPMKKVMASCIVRTQALKEGLNLLELVKHFYSKKFVHGKYTLKQ